MSEPDAKSRQSSINVLMINQQREIARQTLELIRHRLPPSLQHDVTQASHTTLQSINDNLNDSFILGKNLKSTLHGSRQVIASMATDLIQLTLARSVPSPDLDLITQLKISLHNRSNELIELTTLVKKQGENLNSLLFYYQSNAYAMAELIQRQNMNVTKF
jgi:hypothetical protein